MVCVCVLLPTKQAAVLAAVTSTYQYTETITLPHYRWLGLGVIML